MNPTCRQSRPASPFPPVPQLFSWKNPVTGLQVQRSFILVCCHGPKEVHTEWCNISYHCLLPPSRRPFIIISPSFSIPSAISLDWIAPWPRAPLTMWCCILSPAPSPPPPPTLHCPSPYTDSSGVEVVWLMSSNPISQCSRPSPAGGFSHAIQQDQSEWPPLCILITVPRPWKHIYKLQIGSCLQRRGRDNASDYSQVITEMR